MFVLVAGDDQCDYGRLIYDPSAPRPPRCKELGRPVLLRNADNIILVICDGHFDMLRAVGVFGEPVEIP
jgi:hypothetical protein